MAKDISYPSLYIKDLNGNVGYLRGLTFNDIEYVKKLRTDVNTAITTSENAVTKADNAQATAEANTDIINYSLKPQIASALYGANVLVDLNTKQVREPTHESYGAVKLANEFNLSDKTAGYVVDTALLATSNDLLKADVVSTLNGYASLSLDQIFSGAQKFLGKVTFSGDTGAVTLDDATDSSDHVASTAWVNKYDKSRYLSLAQQHNHIFRGVDLLSDGHFSDVTAILTAIRNGDFSDIYVGDYFTVLQESAPDAGTQSSVTYVVAGLNLLDSVNGTARAPNACLVTGTPLFGGLVKSMNSNATSEGGYKGSNMYTEILPQAYQVMAGSEGTPFYGYIKTHNERLSSAIDATLKSSAYAGWSGASSSLEATDVSLNLLSDVEVFGAPICSSSCYDNATVVKLPLFNMYERGMTMGINLGDTGWFSTSFWLRNVSNSTSFGIARDLQTPTSSIASDTHSVIVRFFVG